MTETKDFKNEDIRINYITDEIKRYIMLFNKEYKIDFIAIENQFVSFKNSSILPLRKLLGSVCRMAYKELNISIEYISPKEVKKTLTEKGNATKEEVAGKIINEYINIGEYIDKSNKNKTSDIYDSVGVAISIIKKIK